MKNTYGPYPEDPTQPWPDIAEVKAYSVRCRYLCRTIEEAERVLAEIITEDRVQQRLRDELEHWRDKGLANTGPVIPQP